MAYTVIVKKRFAKTVTVLLKYLENEWGKKLQRKSFPGR
jgi:hypothetical protein